jgi:hypothetical protein
VTRSIAGLGGGNRAGSKHQKRRGECGGAYRANAQLQRHKGVQEALKSKERRRALCLMREYDVSVV